MFFFFNLLIKFCWCWWWLCRWWWWWCWWYWWWWIAALCAVNYFQYALLGSVRLTKWAEILRLSTGADLNNLPLPTGPSWTLSCMVGFWHWHIPTFIITDIFPPWWDFVMVGICRQAVMMVITKVMMTITCDAHNSVWDYDYIDAYKITYIGIVGDIWWKPGMICLEELASSVLFSQVL